MTAPEARVLFTLAQQIAEVDSAAAILERAAARAEHSGREALAERASILRAAAQTLRTLAQDDDNG